MIPKVKSVFGAQGAKPTHPHVGIAYLTAFLKKRGYQIAIFDEGLEKDKRNLFEAIKKFQPDIIGITIYSFCFDQALKTIRTLKKRYKIPVILGGPHVSAVKGEALRTTKADFAMAGEAEYGFLSFLGEMVKNKQDFSKVPNLIWRLEKKIIENSPAPLIKDLDGLPFPDYEAFDLRKYAYFAPKTLSLLTSRGCPYGCTYCSVRLSMGRGFRPRSPENVLAEIKYWYDKGYNGFDINDDCFTFDLDRAEKICEAVIKENLKIHFQLYNGIRVDRVSLPLLRKMKKAGCTFIAYGCEAGNERILKSIHKGITLDQVRKAVKWANKAGINNAVNFIVGHAQETFADALDSLKFAESLPTNYVNFYNLVPYPGTEAYEWALQNAKFIYPKKSYLEKISYGNNLPIYETKEFTKEERELAIEKGRALYEKKLIQFRLGKVLGFLVFSLSRFPVLHDWGTYFVLNNAYARKIFVFLSARSRS